MQRNTLITLSDNKIGIDQNADNKADFYTASVLSATDYYTFGMSMKERSWQSESYRYGFNGKEKDSDIGEEMTDFGARLMNSKIDRWMAVDPLAGKYASISSYAFVANSPLIYVDPDGKVIRIADGVDQETRTKIENYLTILREIMPEIFAELDKPEVDIEISVGKLNPGSAYKGDYQGSFLYGTTNVSYLSQKGLEVFDIETEKNEDFIPTGKTKLMSRKTFDEQEELRKNLGDKPLTEAQIMKEISLEEGNDLVTISENKIKIILDPKTLTTGEKRQAEIIGHELGHAYYDVMNKLLSWLWGEIEDYVNNNRQNAKEPKDVYVPSHAPNNPNGKFADETEKRVGKGFKEAKKKVKEKND